MKIIKEWWKPYSVWLLIAANCIAELAAFSPDLQEVLPAHWYQWALRIILIARIIQQKTAEADVAAKESV